MFHVKIEDDSISKNGGKICKETVEERTMGLVGSKVREVLT